MDNQPDRIIQPSQPVDDLKKDPLAEEVVTAWSVGMGRNEIARTLGISRYRVSKIADAHGLEFDTKHTAAATQVHAERAKSDRATLESRWASLAHDELDKAEQELDPQSRFMHIKSAAVATDKSVALADSANRLDTGADAAEEGKRLVAIQMGLMMNNAEKVREIMADPTPNKPQPGLWSVAGGEDDEPP
jgi:hypothetical protein